MNRILEKVQSGDFDPVKVFTGDKDTFLEVKAAIESISDKLSTEVCVKFVLTKIIPTVFDKNVDDTVRDETIDIGFHFLKFVSVSNLSSKEQESIFTSIEEIYTKTIGDLRDGNYHNWDKLWIFLVKLCNEKLHTKMSLANKLLRVVEVAFRNSTSIEQRLKAYDCWVELINNSSLNMEHMCSAKQIKLLITPMKAKFSRMPIVIMKRCDTFVYLLEKLQDKATLCLKEFLEFCFGPFEEKHDVEKMRQGRSVPEVCSKSTKVLIEIIGHSHELENCLISDDLQLYKPLINDVNFPNFAEILINSVTECCILLNDWSQDSSSNNTIIKCLWRSILKLISSSNDEIKKKCSIQINNSLRKLLERSKFDKSLLQVLGSVVDLLIVEEMASELKETLFHISMTLLTHVSTDSCSLENVLNFIDCCFDGENLTKYDKLAANYFNSDANCENSNMLCEVWLKCKIIVTPDNVSNIIWPVRHLQNFKDLNALNSKWTKLYNSECKTDTMKVTVMQELEKLFLENPLLSSNVVEFLQLISSSEINPSKDFVAKFMRLIELVLTLPNLSNADIKKLSSVVLSYFNQSQYFYKSDNNDEALDKLCGCLEHLVTIHKEYKILTELSILLKSSQPKSLLKFSKRLLSFLEALMLNEENTVISSTRKLIEMLETKENEPEKISVTSSRSLRIMSMANITPKSKKLVQTNNLKLFGKDVSKPSPLSLKGSKSSPRSKGRISDDKNKNIVLSLNEDKSSDYVKIDTEVKINLDNLNEHQREMFKKRREDIPALYQDLTQSQSQEFFKNLAEDKDNEVTPGFENHITSESLEKNENEPPSNTQKSDCGDNEHIRLSCKISEESTLINGTEKNNSVENIEQNLSKPESEVQIMETTEEDLPRIFSDEKVINNVLEDNLTNIIDSVTPTLDSEKIDEHSSECFSEAKTDSVAIESSQMDSVIEDMEIGNLDEEKETSQEQRNNNSEDVADEEHNVSQSSSKSKVKENTLERKIRKSKRTTAQRLREELVNAVKRQLEKCVDEPGQLDSDISTPEASVNCAEENDSSRHENGIVQENLDDTEMKSTDNVQETFLRKSKRQIKKRHNDYIATYGRTKKQSDAESVKENESTIISESSQTEHVNKSRTTQDHKTVEEKVDSVLDDNVLGNSTRKKRKQPKEQLVRKQNVKVNKKNKKAEESMEDLLARVDKRIEKNRRLEESRRSKQEQIELIRNDELVQDSRDDSSVTMKKSDLQNGNQNQIISSSLKDSKEVDSKKSENLNSSKKSRPPFIQAKRRVTPSIKKFPILKIKDTTNTEMSSEKSSDVYEFKGDEGFTEEETKKPLKKKRKSMSLNKSDYISKRRKKSRKETKAQAEGFPFHVTADCSTPLPLSKSHSLRAVPSPQESETITILITRSPPNAPKSPQISDSSFTNDTKHTSPKRKNRRKQSPEVPNSEDVIESSQVVLVNTTKSRSSPSKNKSRSLKETTIDEIIKPLTLDFVDNSHKRKTRSSSLQEKDNNDLSLPETLTLESVKEPTPEEDTITVHISKKTCDVPMQLRKSRRFSLTESSTQGSLVKRTQRSKSLDKIDLISDEVFTFSLTSSNEVGKAVRVNDTLPDTLTCEPVVTDANCETVAMGVEEETDIAQLEKSTVKSDSEEVISDTTKDTVITNLENEVVKSDLQEADTLTLSPVKNQTKEDLPGSPVTCDTPDRTTELFNNTLDISPISATHEEMNTPTLKPSTNEVTNVRVARLLQMVNSNVQVSNTGRRWFGNKHSSPSSSRVRKMRLKKEENLDILTFSREIPSPLTIPASGILKRKFHNLDETPLAPAPKRKRVNFSDPAITDKKIFIKDAEEYCDTDQYPDSSDKPECSADDGEDLNEKSAEEEIKELGALERKNLFFGFKDFCDSSFKDISVDSSKVKSALKHLVENLKVPEVVEIISEYLINSDSRRINEINSTLIESGASQQVIDKCVVPLIQNLDVFEGFLPKLLDVAEKLSSEKLQQFIDELAKLFGENKINSGVNQELAEKSIEDHVAELDCDKMNDLIKNYFSNLTDQKRNDFLVNLMSLASNELPVNKEFVNCHVNILQNFVNRMTE